MPFAHLNLTKVTDISLHHMANATAGVKEVEKWHINKGWRGIGYNFWVGFDGTVYRGRGFNLGAGVENQNDSIMSIGFQGDYENANKTMPDVQFNAGLDIIDYVRQNIPSIKKVAGHKAFMPTACPGKYFPLSEMQAGIKRGEQIKNKGYNYKKVGETHIIEVDPLLVGCWVTDKAANKIDIGNFVNGGYFGWQGDGKTYSSGHLVNDGVILSNVATHGVAVTTLCVFEDGVVQVKPIFDISLERGLKFAISGAGIYPKNNLEKEGFTGKFADVGRVANRTYIGYRKKDNKIVICVRPSTGIARAQETFKSLGVDAGLTLDGGGSSCMRFDGEYKLLSTRRIHNIVMWG